MSAEPAQPQRDPHGPTPYATAAEFYWSAGWRGVLPLPPRRKANPPNGWTGRDGAWPSYADVRAWTEDQPTGNICLRLPPNVIGVDVDHYGDKTGGDVLAELERQLGPLPATWRVTSRDDGVSGIRLFRVPEGLRWPGVFGAGIESIRSEHRYAVAWPSIHPEGRTYRWIGPDGVDRVGDVPTPDDLPDIPDAWVQHFTQGQRATDQARVDLDGAAVNAWVQQRGQGTTCQHMARALTDGVTAILSGTSRHDATLALTNRIVWLAGEGHTGAVLALNAAHTTFMQAVAGDRSPGDAHAEWGRLVDGAVKLAAAAHPNPSPYDPCLAGGLEGLMAPPFTPQPYGQPYPDPQAGTGAFDWTAPTSVATSDTKPAQEPPQRSSWWPRDDDGDDEDDDEPPPVHLIRDDGVAMFYAGRVNGIIGPSESGKSWLALHAVVQAITAGCHVTYLDFEDTLKGIRGRLRALGVTGQQRRQHFRYIGPDEPLASLAQSGADLTQHLTEWHPDIVIIDGVNAAMTSQGLNLNDNMDATRFAQTILKPLAEQHGACVIYVDHVTKMKTDGARGAIGAQAKRSMTTGCCLSVEVVKEFGKGQDGVLRVRVDKDRQGDVRGASLPSKDGMWAGTVKLASRDDGDVEIVFESPGTRIADSESKPFRPTNLMEKASRYIEDHPGATQSTIVRETTGNNDYLRDAIARLVDEGFVTRTARGQSHLHTSIKPFREADEAAGEGTAPTAPEPHPNRTQGAVPNNRTHRTHPPIYRGGGGGGVGSGLRTDDTAPRPSGGARRRLVKTSDPDDPRVAYADTATGELCDEDGEPIPYDRPTADVTSADTPPCVDCGLPISELRAAAGKALCIDCATATRKDI